MWLGALERLVLLFVQPLLLMVFLVSFEAWPPRLLSVAWPSHISTHLVPQVAVGVPQRSVFQLVLHDQLELGVLHLAAFVTHFSPANIRKQANVAVTCH